MSTHAWMTSALAVGLLGLGALVVLRSPPDEAPPDMTTELLDRIAGLERRLDDAGPARERSRVADPTVPPVVPETSHVEPDAASGASASDEALESRVAELERRMTLVAGQTGLDFADPTSLSDDELLERGGELQTVNRNARGAAGYKVEEAIWREYLGRQITEEQRSTALFGLGITLRGQKRHDEEAAVFEDLVRRAGGVETTDGANAAFQLAWARAYSEDYAEAVRVFDSVADSAGVGPMWRTHSLLRAGQYSMRLDDDQRAREYFQRLLTEHRDEVRASDQWLLTSAETHIRELDAK